MDQATLDRYLETIAEQGYCIVEDAMSPALVRDPSIVCANRGLARNAAMAAASRVCFLMVSSGLRISEIS